jgi:hypothetical protein
MAATPTPFYYNGTVREAYVDVLTELVKEESPTLYVEDFLYYFNKAINEYMKARYEVFEITQQLTDDLRFWKVSINLPTILDTTGAYQHNIFSVDSVPFIAPLSSMPNYRHLLNCMVGLISLRPMVKCNITPNVQKGFKATRFTSDIKASILNNDYLSPQPFRPYFDILNESINVYVGEYDKKSLEISTIQIEYLKHPIYVTLTPLQISSELDSSQRLEFTRDVGDEINKIAIKLILERSSDQRLQSNVAINQTITDPSIRGG